VIFYLRVESTHEGIAVEKGRIEKVDSLASATLLHYGDAAYIRGQAIQQWPDFIWTIGSYEGMYILVGKQT
jgi:hypothetical protein